MKKVIYISNMAGYANLLNKQSRERNSWKIAQSIDNFEKRFSITVMNINYINQTQMLYTSRS